MAAQPTQTLSRDDVKKKLVSQAGPKSVSRGGVSTTFRSASEIIALDKYCKSAESGCVIEDCQIVFGDCW